MIKRENELFILDTKDTTYCFRIMPSGHLEHLYYGSGIHVTGGYNPIIQKNKFIGGNQIAYSRQYPEIGLEDICLEMSSYGKGDIREPFVEITHEDGTVTCDFLFHSARILEKKKLLNTLPSAYYEDNALLIGAGIKQDEEPNGIVEGMSLEVELHDKNYEITLFLVYSTFDDCNVITRSARLVNQSGHTIMVDRLMSSQLDLDSDEYIVSTFHGAWAREMKRFDKKVWQGTMISDSRTGTSSNRSNPFFMVSGINTGEDYGECFGFNLIYSGNHYAAIDTNSMGKVRIVNGINPTGFQFQLRPQEVFEAPEAVMTFSNQGYTGMSHNMHEFIRNHIVSGKWKDKVRPILINSWEANYFKFNEGKLLKQAKAAREAGIELFVLDDGWFGNRNDDTSSLGDWKENREKLHGGLADLAKKINELGMDFGIWVEPEMVNEDSNCFRLHPDWAVRIPGNEHSLGRNQMILDLTREEVRTYIIGEMSRVFSSANIAYVKWDMNRIFSDRYSVTLAPERLKEFDHRYMMGLYQVLNTLTRRFPKILFESCASGGNRFDLGMLCYMPQIWASDNTDAICRAAIQTGCSYGYPMSVIGAHVSSCPNHQTLRNTSIDTRFEVAAFGLLGYECNLGELNTEERKTVAEQITFYKKYRQIFQFGDFYRIKSGDCGIYQWLTVAKDKKQAIGLYLQKEVTPNYSYGKFRTKGLNPGKRYHFTNRQQIFNIKEFGDLINMISPVHIKKDSLAHNIIAKVKKMPGELEDTTAYGDVFNNAGIKLKPGFGSTGYDNEVRLFQDNASRMYLWEEIN